MDIYVAWGILISLFVFGVSPMIMAMATGADYRDCIRPTLILITGVVSILACGGIFLWAVNVVIDYSIRG